MFTFCSGVAEYCTVPLIVEPPDLPDYAAMK